MIHILLIYFCVLWLISRWASKRTDNEAFFCGNRRSPWYVVSFGMIGASLSGVTFVSVPGMVERTDMTYLQTCIGFFFGYVVIAFVLLPLYYRGTFTSIYTYLQQRFGHYTYRTGAGFFILSKTLGAAIRLYLVCVILQKYVFDSFDIPFLISVGGILTLIWVYTRRSGIRTIVWTDALQTACMLLALALILWQVASVLHLDASNLVDTIRQSGHDRIFVFGDWSDKQHFVKQFFSGIFITVVMTGLDQDMMQKNLSCRNLKESRRNMLCYGMAFVPVNLAFLVLGILLLTLGSQQGLLLPEGGDQLLPFFAAEGRLGMPVLVFFTIGVVAAAFSSADSALTALTTSVCVDLLGTDLQPEARATRIRKVVHVVMMLVFVGFIGLFRLLGSTSVLDAIYVLCGYTYGPLLGLFAFGILTRRCPRDRWVPLVCILSPLVCLVADHLATTFTGYRFGYEMLLFNGFLTFVLLWLLSAPYYNTRA